MKLLISRGLLATALMMATATASARDATLELLAQKWIITADEYTALKSEQKDQASVSLKDGLKITSGDGKGTVQLGTLIQMDAASVASDKKDAPSGTEIRRARLAISGNQGPWEFRLETELAGTATLTDAYGAWRGPVTVTAGNFKLPYSLESLMSDKNLAFMERSLSSALLPVRAPGLMVGAGGRHGSWAVGMFGEPLSTATPPTSSASSATANADDEGGGISARGSWAPLIADGQTLHLATSLHYRLPTQAGAGATPTLRLSSKPEANQFADRLVNTGNIGGDVSAYRLAAIELAGAFGPLLAQAEYSFATVARDHASDLQFDGGYVQVAWAITGERRAYKADKGIFEGIRPQKNTAWEVAVRLSALDLGDGNVNGGRERNTSTALNAYIGPVVKLSLNYVNVLDVKGGPFQDDEPSVLMLRGQIAY